ncbi:transposase [Novosphingobium sediminicola]|uniref:Transposase n=1 Tax=Novosphingobium sediminicola TaxID=563162 RepID=A0A7W6CFD4_9SPHN|nr:transposase [Novosphingobium sediminicola]
MLEEETDGLNGDLDHAAQGANRDWDSVPHSGNTGLGGATVLGPQRRNRRWAPQEKAQITAESFAVGANVSAIARRHGVSLGLLHYWRRTARDRGAMDAISMVPMEVDDSVTPTRCDLEIEIGGARILIRGRVERAVLRTVFDALRS